MSGECETDRFFYRGKFFKTQNELWEYVKEFNERQTLPEDFDNLFDCFKQDLCMNLQLREVKINNGRLREVLGDAMLHILETIGSEKYVSNGENEMNDVNISSGEITISNPSSRGTTVSINKEYVREKFQKVLKIWEPMIFTGTEDIQGLLNDLIESIE